MYGKPEIEFLKSMVANLKEWGKAKSAEGLVPTIDLFVEEMSQRIDEIEHNAETVDMLKFEKDLRNAPTIQVKGDE